MKVLLIYPPAETTIFGNNPEVIETERGVSPPLGILYLAGALEARGAHEVRVLDAIAEGLDVAGVARVIASEGPDVVGVTALTFTLVDALSVVRAAKAFDSGIRTVLGGPHPFLYPEATARLPGVDYAVIGEGEEALPALLAALAAGREPEEIPGIAYARDGECRGSGPAPIIRDLDALPLPARHLTRVERYTSVLARRNPITTVFSSRGCPYRCTFCARPHLGARFRARGARAVVDELEACLHLGIREFLFYDDTFTVSRRRVRAICEEIRGRGLSIGWDVRARADHVDPELLEAMAAAGCERIHYGVEAGSDAFLEVLAKGITIEQARRAIRWTKEAGIATLAYFMIGLPGETRDDVLRTMDRMVELDPDYVHVTILTPFPGTKIYADALARGIFRQDHWAAFARDPRPGFEPPFWTEHMDGAELRALLAGAYRRFYVRPAYVARELLRVRSPRELWRKARAGWKVWAMR